MFVFWIWILLSFVNVSYPWLVNDEAARDPPGFCVIKIFQKNLLIKNLGMRVLRGFYNFCVIDGPHGCKVNSMLGRF